MKKQMASGKGKQDVQTPDALARLIVNHFTPSGKICEPCKGNSAFIRALKGRGTVDWYEIKEGKDFFKAEGFWDWIITNPPWNDVTEFLAKSMKHSNNIVFLNWAASWWTEYKLKLIKNNGWGIVEILILHKPRLWKPAGFALSAVWLKKGWSGGITLTQPTRNPKYDE